MVHTYILPCKQSHRASICCQFAQFVHAAGPTDAAKQIVLFPHRLVKDIKHLGADIEGPMLLPLLLDSVSAAFSDQSVVQVNNQLSVVLHHLTRFSKG